MTLMLPGGEELQHLKRVSRVKHREILSSVGHDSGITK
jgi:hypothetical protein